MSMTIFEKSRKPNMIKALELGDFTIDVTLTESHEFSNSVSSYPVESGFDISDNIKQAAPRLTLTGITTATPITYTSIYAKNLLRQDYTNRVQNTFNTLLSMAGYQPPKQAGSDPVKTCKPKSLTIVTGLMVYRNMYITNLTFNIDKTTGESLPYSITFQQVSKVSSKYFYETVVSANVPNAQKQASENVKAGDQTVTEKDSSILSKLYDWWNNE